MITKSTGQRSKPFIYGVVGLVTLLFIGIFLIAHQVQGVEAAPPEAIEGATSGSFNQSLPANLAPAGVQITLQPATGPASNAISVIGSGWPAGQTVTVFLRHQQVNYEMATVKTDNQGAFQVSFFLPNFWKKQSAVTVGVTSGQESTTAIYTVTGQATPTPTPGPTEPQGIVNTQLLNVRNGPGINYYVVGRVALSETVQITGQNGDWWQIEYPNPYSQFGWVSRQFINPINTGNVPLVVAPPPPPTPTPTPVPTQATYQCNPGQWSGCGGASCQAQYVSQCGADGQWGQCVWDPGHCSGNYSLKNPISNSCAVYDPAQNTCVCYYNQYSSDPNCADYRHNPNYQWYPEP